MRSKHIQSIVAPLLLFAGICGYSAGALADTLIRSDARQVALLELYTSEGCSSCPPADRWFSSLVEQPGLWNSFVPVAFHVDYWDYIGWQDRFASPEYSARQRRYAREGGVPVVYTPGLVLDGEEWRDWRRNRLPAQSGDRPGPLNVAIGDDKLTVTFVPRDIAVVDYVANVAWLGFDLSSAVKAGENSGRTLEHDFVVLSVERTEMQRRGGDFVATLTPEPPSAGRLAVAAWVSTESSQLPLQAVGGWVTTPQRDP